MNLKPTLIAAIAVSIAGCQQGNEADDGGWWQDHADRMSERRAIYEAIDEPGGGNYALAVQIVRTSKRSPAEKKLDMGRLIVGSFERSGSRRPAETLQQGLEMIEQAAIEPGKSKPYVPQQLRMLFERGLGTPPNAIPVDREVAACWRKLENGGQGDPAKCVALRRKRLPQLST